MDKENIRLRWSKKENDWLFEYKDKQGKSLTGVFFDIIKTNGHRVEWGQNIKEILTEKGFDYKTLRITCGKLKQNG